MTALVRNSWKLHWQISASLASLLNWSMCCVRLLTLSIIWNGMKLEKLFSKTRLFLRGSHIHLPCCVLYREASPLHMDASGGMTLASDIGFERGSRNISLTFHGWCLTILQGQEFSYEVALVHSKLFLQCFKD